MLADFYTLPEESRVWIYGVVQKLTNEKENYILQSISDHLISWEAHKAPLTAGITIFENHFIVIALDENQNRASGCSIDTLQNKMQDLERELSISLMNRLNVFCRIDDEIQCIPLFELEKFANTKTLFYDLTIQNKSELNSYLKPICEGWCAHLI